MYRANFFLTLVSFIVLLSSCRHMQSNKWQPDTDAVLQVYFFHLTSRCDVCTAIEENTKQVLDEHFKAQIENGTIKYYSFNIDNTENRDVTEKYQISYTSLLLVRSEGKVTDFTNTAFNYANINPMKFRTLLKSEIDKNIE